jgi:hypothetical protein
VINLCKSLGSKYCKFPIAIPNESAASGPLKLRYSVMPYRIKRKAGVENFVDFKAGD